LIKENSMPYPIPVIKTILLFCLLTNSGAIAYAQKDSIYSGMEKFNIERFNKNKDPRTGTYIFTLEDETTIRQVETDKDYLEYTTHPDNYFEKRKSFYKKTGNIRFSNTLLYNFAIGIVRYYNQDGSIEKEIDADASYPVTWEMVVEKIKNEYGVDMLEKDRDMNMHPYKNLSRTEYSFPYYNVLFMTKEGKSYMFTLSGINGIMLKKMNDEGKVEIVNDPPQPTSGKGKSWSIFD